MDSGWRNRRVIMIGKYLGLDRKDGFTSYDVDKKKFYEQIKKNKKYTK